MTHYHQDGGVDVWGVAAEVRLHTREPQNQLAIGLGAGWGQLNALQEKNGDTEGEQGLSAPYVEGVLAYRRMLNPSLRLGVDLTVHAFNRVYLVGDLGTRFCVTPPAADFGSIMTCPERRTFFMFGLALSLGFRP